MGGRQGAGRRLTDAERLQIIALARQDPRVRHVDLARQFAVDESTIRKWRRQANAERVQRRYVRAGPATRDALQRGQSSRSERFEVALHQWISTQQLLGCLPSGARIREEARARAAHFGGMADFKASTGWYYRFCARFDLPRSVAEHRRLVSASAAAATATTGVGKHPRVAGPTSSSRANSVEPGGAANDLETAAAADADKALGVVGASEALGSPRLSRCGGLGRAAPDARSNADSAELLASEAGGASASPPPAAAPSADGSGSRRGLTVPQEAIAHFVAHHKELVDVSCRLRLIRHLARAPGEAEMYVVMDDETRVEYIREFALEARGRGV